MIKILFEEIIPSILSMLAFICIICILLVPTIIYLIAGKKETILNYFILLKEIIFREIFGEYL